MDPLTALGLGANVLQFIDFVGRLISVGREVAESQTGATIENADLEAISRSLVWLNGRVMSSINEQADYSRVSQSLSNTMRDIDSLGAACNGVAGELLDALGKLKMGDKYAKWKGPLTALKTVWKKGQIDSLRERLDQYRATMQTALIVSLREEVYAINQGVRKSLDPDSAVDRSKVDLLEYVKKHDLKLQSWESSVLATFSDKLTKMTKLEQDIYCKSQLLEHIGFHEQGEREHRIVGAHEKSK